MLFYEDLSSVKRARRIEGEATQSLMGGENVDVKVEQLVKNAMVLPDARKVLIPIATGIELAEVAILVDVLRRVGAKVTVASVENDLEVVGIHGFKLVSDQFISECSDVVFDRIVLPAGMSVNLKRWTALQNMVKIHVVDGKVVISHGLGTSMLIVVHLVEQLFGQETAKEVFPLLAMYSSNSEPNLVKFTNDNQMYQKDVGEKLEVWLTKKERAWLANLGRELSKKKLDGDKKNWWAFIGSNFKCIFRDILYQVWDIYNDGRSHGSLESNIVVKEERRGVRAHVLPSEMSDLTGAVADLNAIRNMIWKFIAKPFMTPFDIQDVENSSLLIHGVNPGDGTLLGEIYGCLMLLKDSYLPCARLTFLMDISYFWSPPEKVHFLEKLRELLVIGKIDMGDFSAFLQYDDWPFNLIHKELQRCYTDRVKKWKKNEKEDTSNWDYSSIIQKEGMLEPMGGSSIVMFCVDVFKHFNDVHRSSKKYEEMLTKSEIEKVLSESFTELYVRLREAALFCIQDTFNVDMIKWNYVQDRLWSRTI